jgi:hypothetical protein
MLSPEAIHEIKDIAVTIAAISGTGVSGLALNYLRKGTRIAKAVAHAPELLHGHDEAGAEPLTAAGVRYLEPRT